MNGSQIAHYGLRRQYKNLRQELLDKTDDVLRSGVLVSGGHTRILENWLRTRCKTNYAVTVHSGTQALEIIARYAIDKNRRALGDKISDDYPVVQLPNLTYPATLNAFITAGYKTIELCDTDKYGIMVTDPYNFACLVGLYGRRPWYKMRSVAEYVIVDGAQHWLVADGDIGMGMAISFDPTKNLNASGNGGAIVTNDYSLYVYASDYRTNSSPNFQIAGTNSKMSELDCAHVSVRAQYIDQWQLRRKQINDYYCERFEDLPVTCLSKDDGTPHAYQKYVIYMNDRNSLHTHLLLNGIQSKISYEYVLGDLPVGKDLIKPDLLSTSVMLSRGVISLPIYPELTDSEVEYIADKVNEFF